MSLCYHNDRCNYIITNIIWPHNTRDLVKEMRRQGLVEGKSINYHKTFARWVWPFDDGNEIIKACEDFIDWVDHKDGGLDSNIGSFEEVMPAFFEFLNDMQIEKIKSRYLDLSKGPLFINREYTYSAGNRAMKYNMRGVSPE